MKYYDEEIMGSGFEEFFLEDPLSEHTTHGTLGSIARQYECAERTLISGSPHEAAKQCGLSDSGKGTKREIANRVLLERQAENIAKLRITADNVLQEYARLAFFDVRQLYDEKGRLKRIIDLDDNIAAAIVGVDIKTMGKEDNFAELLRVKMADKKAALDALAKRLKLFDDTQRVVVEGNLAVGKMGKTEKARRIAFMLEEAIRKKQSSA